MSRNPLGARAGPLGKCTGDRGGGDRSHSLLLLPLLLPMALPSGTRPLEHRLWLFAGQAIMVEKVIAGKKVKDRLKIGECELCLAVARQKGIRVETLAPGRGRAHSRARRKQANDTRIPRPTWACPICKVRLCRKGGEKMCFKRWCHDGNCAPCERQLVL